MKWFIVICAVFMLSGCGVDWFPETTTNSASPNGFSFASKSVTQTVASSGAFSISDSVIVQGNNASGWTVSVTDATGAKSQFSINGKTFTSTPDTILPNQSLQVQNVPSPTVGGQSITTVKVGDFETTFITNTIANP
jgi:hypothetical protein